MKILILKDALYGLIEKLTKLQNGWINFGYAIKRLFYWRKIVDERQIPCLHYLTSSRGANCRNLHECSVLQAYKSMEGLKAPNV